MKPLGKPVLILLSVLLAAWVLPAGAAAPDTSTSTSSGRISAINLKADTVVVEVPIGQNKHLTVGGPVIEDADLQKNGKKVDLSAFKVGDWVQITWEKTDETLLIKELASK